MQLMGTWVPAFSAAVARHLETEPFVTFSFATVDGKGNPSVRTCIYRGFVFGDKKTNVLSFTTDSRMEKLGHVQTNGKFEACFWFPKSNKQFRLSGQARTLTFATTNEINAAIGEYPLVSPNLLSRYRSFTDLAAIQSTASQKPTSEEWEQELQSKWNDLSPKLKSSFRKPAPGSTVTGEKKKLLDSIARGVDGASETDGQKNYALVLLLVDRVDYVDLNGHQARYIYERYDSDQWSEEEVCP